MRRVLGRQGTRTADQTLFNRVQEAMSVRIVDEYDQIFDPRLE
jgi:hypothetical protein